MVDEISIEEFEELREDEVSKGIVNWESVLENFEGRVVSFKDLSDYVKKEYKKVLYRSEWDRICDVCEVNEKSKYEIVSKKLNVGSRLKRLYVIRKR